MALQTRRFSLTWTAWTAWTEARCTELRPEAERAKGRLPTGSQGAFAAAMEVSFEDRSGTSRNEAL
jgi:hypothetical protein